MATSLDCIRVRVLSCSGGASGRRHRRLERIASSRRSRQCVQLSLVPVLRRTCPGLFAHRRTTERRQWTHLHHARSSHRRPSAVSCRPTTVRRPLITLGVQLCVQRDGRDARRRAGLSASAATCLIPRLHWFDMS